MALQKPLRGFSNFIGLFRGGNIRLDPVPTLQPVIEMEDFLEPNPFLLSQVNVVNEGDELLFVVPDGHFWRCKWIGSYYVPPAAEALLTRILYRPFEGIGSIDKIYLDRPQGSFAGYDSPNGNESGHGLRLKDFNARAGDRIGIEVSRKLGASAYAINAFLQYQDILV